MVVCICISTCSNALDMVDQVEVLKGRDSGLPLLLLAGCVSRLVGSTTAAEPSTSTASIWSSMSPSGCVRSLNLSSACAAPLKNNVRQ